MEQKQNAESPRRAGDTAALPDFIPVPVRYRRDGWTSERQRLYVAALAETGHAGGAAIPPSSPLCLAFGARLPHVQSCYGRNQTVFGALRLLLPSLASLATRPRRSWHGPSKED